MVDKLKDPFWIAVGLDPVKETCWIMGCGITEADTRDCMKRSAAEVGEDTIYRNTFNILKEPIWTVKEDMVAWFRQSGIAKTLADDLFRDLMHMLKQKFKEME